ncbi:GNAT family N-acetyltransferase [Arundinibacter roseus]|uniref:Uncharacterized protein n=1 Tax=Arundinibacter roseus TaxID=2070510 RepID=A0A4R4K738_9BACT|nr:hypothetical protein [Arundinibacter roseus]TDB63308.1 hypothetical protein EZE20_16165 [Arundinibacter roseus]
MKKIDFKLHQSINEEMIETRFNCFNEILHYYKNIESSRETYDKNSTHLGFYIDGNFAGYTRFTECPNNYMALEKLSDIKLSNDKNTLEMGRTFVLPDYREFKLLNVILGIGLNICRQIGYKKVIGNVSFENHIKMPSTLGFEFTNELADFRMQFSDKGKHTFYLLECDLEKTNAMRQSELQRLQKILLTKDYEFEIY